MIRAEWFAIFLLVFAAAESAAQEQKVQVRGWDPLFIELGGEETKTATISGRLLAHEAAHTVQQRRAQGATPLAGSIRTARSSVTYPGGSSLDLEVKAGGAGGGGGGTALSNLPVTLEAIPGGPRQTTSTDGSGRFAFENVRPGGYQLSWEARGQRNYQQIWIEELANLRETGLEGACRRRCSAEHTNAQGALNADAYAACMRECRSAAAVCPAPAVEPSR